MDWNKTKTVFIIVFSILNVFLYWLYLDRYTEAQNIQVIGETSIEESLQLDNISYGELPTHHEEASYVLAEVVAFSEEDLDQLSSQSFEVIDNNHLISTLKASINVHDGKDGYEFSTFLSKYVLYGEEYMLWKVDEDRQQALFFQRVNDYPIYYNKNAMLTVYWDEDGDITHYEQWMFGKFESYNKKKGLLPPIQAMNTLYSRGYLKQDSTVTSMELGYSTLIQLTETQVFAPTWHVRVELLDGKKEDYFINAIDGKTIEFQSEAEDE